MIYSKRDIETLKTLHWCQYVLPEDLCRFTSADELENLLERQLVKYHKKSGALVLTGSGLSLLTDISADALPNQPQPYHDYAITRRIRLSKLTVTALRAGVNTFSVSSAALACSPTLFRPTLARTHKTNPWGSARVAALLRLADTIYAAHYVCPDIGKIALTDELRTFSNQTAAFRNVRQSLIFAGVSYASILEELETSAPDTDKKSVTYGQAYRQLQLPVHLLSCDDTGAMQLKVMAVPEYRSVFSRAALGALYTPPPKDTPAWDALYQGIPFVMAADMELRRVDTALNLARAQGYEHIAIAGLEGQANAILAPRYQDTGKAEVFSLTEETLRTVLGKQAMLYTPSATQYLTEKGEVVYAPSLKAAGKAGGHYHKQMGDLV